MQTHLTNPWIDPFNRTAPHLARKRPPALQLHPQGLPRLVLEAHDAGAVLHAL